MTEELSKFKIIEVAYKSRLLFPTAKEFEDAVGLAWKTIVEYDKNGNTLKLEECYNRINRILKKSYKEDFLNCTHNEMQNVISRYKDLNEFILGYIRASRFYNSLDWGDRNHSASKKKFCRLLFRRYILSGKELGGESEIFGSKNSDMELLYRFFPNGNYERPAVDLEWILIFVFDIFRPWNEKSRVRENENKKEISFKRFTELCETLQNDINHLYKSSSTLSIGVYEKVEELLRESSIFVRITNIDSVNILIFLTYRFGCLHEIFNRGWRIRQMQKISNQGLVLPGIWIDDIDKGVTRFWVFLGDGKFFRYEKEDTNSWVCKPYICNVQEFMKDAFHLTLLDTEAFLRGYFEKEDNECCALLLILITNNTKELNKIYIYNQEDENLAPFLLLPSWLNWDSWEQLSKEDNRYEEFYDVLMERAPYSVRMIASRYTVPQNCFVGRDLKYIYLYDGKPGEFRVIDSPKGSEIFRLDNISKTNSIFELEISEEHPLYAIPINFKRQQKINKEQKEEDRKIEDRIKEKHENDELDMYLNYLAAAKEPETYYIFHDNENRSFCLTEPIPNQLEIKYYYLDEIISKTGGRKFTSSPFKFQSENPEQIAEDSTQD